MILDQALARIKARGRIADGLADSGVNACQAVVIESTQPSPLTLTDVKPVTDLQIQGHAGTCVARRAAEGLEVNTCDGRPPPVVHLDAKTKPRGCHSILSVASREKARERTPHLVGLKFRRR